jgi:hypothetical protein
MGITAAQPGPVARAPHRVLLPIALRAYQPPQPCLPVFGPERPLLTIDTAASIEWLATADLNGDGWTDAIVVRNIFQTLQSFEISILLNDQRGGLVDATHQVFDGPVPRVQHPSKILLRDFSGDGRTDVFIANSGMDTSPHPGYQNTLVLSAPGGKLVDATASLPQQLDNTHRAAAADIDGDGDTDLYVANLWGQNMFPPAIWLNSDGAGTFVVATGRLPYPLEDLDFGAYTTCEFVDVNNDGSPDLVLGDAGDDLQGGPDSLVLLNDGSGYFSYLANAIPPKPFAETDVALDIDATDINSDGYQDLLMLFTKESYTGRYIQVLTNKGDGTFVDETSTRISQTYDDGWLSYLQLLDLNYDGHVDLVAQRMAGPGPMFYLNNGHGAFREWDHGLDLANFVFLDIDRDGWRDILNSGDAFAGWPEWHAIRRHIGCQETAP